MPPNAHSRRSARTRAVKNLIEILQSILIMRAFRHAGREAIRSLFAIRARDWKRDCGANARIRQSYFELVPLGVKGIFFPRRASIPQTADRVGFLISRLLLTDTRDRLGGKYAFGLEISRPAPAARRRIKRIDAVIGR